jgi:hypothetical protein
MEYPTFDIDSIKQRFEADINRFNSEYHEEDKTGLTLVTDISILNEKSDLDSAIRPIVTYINTHLDDEDYVDAISKKEDTQQKQLWIARTYLFYQLLIFETVILKSETLYEEVFSHIDKAVFPFRPDIIPELTYFKMGIFGSITPTSDIDVGIQYSGTRLAQPGLAYIVSRFESLFVIFTMKKKGSLSYDIETYANMLTLPNPNSNDSEHPDYFYLDSSIFTKQNFQDMLICAGKSIVRNVILAYEGINQKIDIENFTFNTVKRYEKFSAFDSSVDSDIADALSNPDWFTDAKNDVDTFLKMSYEEQRYAYYKKVQAAELKKFEKTRDLVSLNSDSNAICEMMILIGDADAYRMESYTCSPTVVHVVRILQANKNDPKKYATIIPKEHCKGEIQHLDPYCSIGKFGYALSILEQMGFIYRFYLTYCQIGNDNYYNKDDCSKKEKKYMGRYDDAFVHIQKYIEGPVEGPVKGPVEAVGQLGGYSKKYKRKSKHRRTKHKRTKKTKRYRRHKKYYTIGH